LDFQELEQEKYHLRRRLEIAEEEFDARVNELQHDVTKLRKDLSDNANMQRQAEKEKSMLIQTLTEQNQRLTQQLKEVSFSNQNNLKKNVTERLREREAE
jgi:hypothetical protein